MNDLISRQAAIDALRNAENHAFNSYYKGLVKAHKIIADLPPVTPQPKIGHWITENMFDGDVAYRCSECNELFWIECGTPKDNKYNFCPKCGERLIEPQEREVYRMINYKMVSHPSHYNLEGKKECIEQMREDYGETITAVFCLTNAYKYLYRAGHKGSKEQDIAKAKWYYGYFCGLEHKIVLVTHLQELAWNIAEALKDEDR